MKVIITKQGAALECNHWTEGQEIDCHENVGNHFIDQGYAVMPGDEVEVKKEDEVKQPKTKKK
ncbi:MAG: hypothetical protein V4538_15555 [Bacteroidota bacterium]